MNRFLLTPAAAGLLVLLTTLPAPALRIAMKPPVQRALSADAVVIGKVTSIEKETVDATPFAGAPNKISYKVAVVKIDTALAGVKDVTHIKVGFIPPPPAAPAEPVPGGPRPAIGRINIMPELKVGSEFVFFLAKHPDAGFYTLPAMSPPLDLKAEETKKEIEALKKVLSITADPMKALKAEKAEDRAVAATILATKYRSYPDAGGEVDQVAIPADESKLILKGLAEADWTKFDRMAPNGMQAFYSLGLTDKDGWVAPKAQRPQPGQPPVNFNDLTKTAFVKWVDGPGKDYTIKRIVAKKK